MVVVGRNNGVVALARFSCKYMYGLLFGATKGVVVLTEWSHGGVPLYYIAWYTFGGYHP